MNTFKRKSLHALVLVGLAAIGAAGTANATPITCTEKVPAYAPYQLTQTERAASTSVFLYQITVSDNSCAALVTPFPTKRPVAQRQLFKYAVNTDPWARQKAKATAYSRTFKQQYSPAWQHTNSAVGLI